jgi:hypothetical protein
MRMIHDAYKIQYVLNAVILENVVIVEKAVILENIVALENVVHSGKIA